MEYRTQINAIVSTDEQCTYKLGDPKLTFLQCYVMNGIQTVLEEN